MRVDVFVVVAARKFPELPVEAPSAGVVLPGRTPAIATPVSEGLDDLAHRFCAGENRATLAHGDVVGGIEARGGEMTEGTNRSSVERRSDGVACVLDEPQVVSVGQFG